MSFKSKNWSTTLPNRTASDALCQILQLARGVSCQRSNQNRRIQSISYRLNTNREVNQTRLWRIFVQPGGIAIMLLMSTTRRFLFLYSLTGGGHFATARAVADALENRFGKKAEVTLVDIFTESGVWPFSRFPQWYPAMLGLRAWPWRLMYRASDHSAMVRGASQLLWPYVQKPLRELLSGRPADIIVSFHPVPNAILERYRRTYAPQTPLAVVVQDFVTAPSAWFTPGFEAYFLPWQETRVLALTKGLPDERLHVSGMPVRQAFLHMMNAPKSRARAMLGVTDEKPLVLFIGGGDGMGDMFPFVQAFMARTPRAQTVVISGRNEMLKNRLLAHYASSDLQVLGFEKNIPLWMRAADILVTKAGPNTLAEAFLMGLPSVIYHAIPGQESGNPYIVEKNGAGVWAPEPQRAAETMIHLLQHEDERMNMAACARKLARPRAADIIAKRLWELSA